MPDIARSSPLYINSFPSGYYSNRSPLAPTPNGDIDSVFSGLNMRRFYDGTWRVRDGLNRHTTGTADFYYKFYGYFLSGSPVVIGDSGREIDVITTTTVTNIYTKNGADRAYFTSNGENLYFTVNSGSDVPQKRVGTATVKKWGITRPSTGIGGGALTNPSTGMQKVRVGWRYVYSYVDSTDQHVSSCSVIGVTSGNFGAGRRYVVEGTTSSEARVDEVWVFRTKDGGSTYFYRGKGTNNKPTTPTLALQVTGAGVCTNGVHYATVVNKSTTGVRSQQATNSNSVTVDGTHNKITINYAVGPAGTASREIFMTLAGGSTLKLALTVSDNTTTSSTIDIADGTLNANETIQTSGNWALVDETATSDDDTALNTGIVAPINQVNDPPPSTIQEVTFHAGRIWAIDTDQNAVIWSGDGALTGVPEECFDPNHIFYFPIPPHALQPTSQGLLIFCASSIYLIRGYSEADFTVQLIRDRLGVLKQECVAADGDTIYILSSNGQIFRISDSIENISKPLSSSDLALLSPTDGILTIYRSGSHGYMLVGRAESSSTPDAFDEYFFTFDLEDETWSTKANSGFVLQGWTAIQTGDATFRLLVSAQDASALWLLYVDPDTRTDGSSGMGNARKNILTPSITFGSFLFNEPDAVSEIAAIYLELSSGSAIPDVTVYLNDIQSNGLSLASTDAIDSPYIIFSVSGPSGHKSKKYFLNPSRIARHVGVKLAWSASTSLNPSLYSIGIETKSVYPN